MTLDLHDLHMKQVNFNNEKPTCKCNNDSLYSSQCWDNKLPKQIMLNDLPVLSSGTNWQLQVAEKIQPSSLSLRVGEVEELLLDLPLFGLPAKLSTVRP